jgi:DNA-binding PadR family transcriptional regulator
MDITNLELAVIGLIAESPKHGYQIEQDIQQRGMREWAEIGFSSIYHVLNKLEKLRWLTSNLDASGQGPARKVYSLSPQGREGYHHSVLTRLKSPRRYSSDFELAMANLNALSREEILSSLEQYVSSLKSIVNNLTQKQETDRQHGLPLNVELLFDHSLNALHSEISWIQSIIPKIQRQKSYDNKN